MATWNDYSPGGATLPKRSLGIRLSTSEFLSVLASLPICFVVTAQFDAVLRITFGLGAESTLSTLFRVFAYPALVALSFSYARTNSFKRVARELEVEIGENDLVVSARFCVDGFEYGRDVGRLSLESGWLFFEGERTTFSLSPRELYPIRKSSAGPVLSVKPFGKSLQISLESIGGRNPKLRPALDSWRSNARPKRGVALLPPLEPLGHGQFSRSQRPTQTLLIALVVLSWIAAILILIYPPNHGHHYFQVALRVGLPAAVLAGCAHRVFLSYQRSLAFNRLGKLQMQVRELEEGDIRVEEDARQNLTLAVSVPMESGQHIAEKQ